MKKLVCFIAVLCLAFGFNFAAMAVDDPGLEESIQNEEIQDTQEEFNELREDRIKSKYTSAAQQKKELDTLEMEELEDDSFMTSD